MSGARRALVAALAALALGAPARAESQHPEHAWLRFGALAPPAGAPSPAPASPPVDASHGFEEVLVRITAHLAADGVVEERERRVLRFLTPEGIQERGNLEFPVRASHDEVSIEEAWIEDAGGARRTVDPRTVQVRTDDEPDVYSDVYEVVVPMPGVAVGSTAVLETRRRFRGRDWPLPWTRIIALRSLAPLQRVELTLTWDPAVPEPVWRSDEPALACRREGAARLACAGGPFPAFPVDPDLDTWMDHLPTLVVGRALTWQELAADYARLLDERTQPDQSIRALAAELRARSAGPDETLRRIHRFVADQVRYVGLEHGAATVVPDPAPAVLARRYGDCKDQVALFVALARAAGVPAHGVLVATELSRPERALLPGWRWFDHMIACATPGAGEPVCVDLTTARFPSGRLPAGVQGRVALDLRPDATGLRTLAAERHAFEVDVRSDTEIRCDGSLREELVRRFPGSWGAALRGHLLSLPADERRTWLRGEYREVFGDRVEPAIEIEDLEDPDRDLVLRSVTEFPARGDASLDRYTELSPWLRYYAGSVRTENRHHPYRFTGLRVSEQARFRPCPGSTVERTGPTLEFRARFGALDRRYERAPEGVDVATRLELEPGRYDGGERDAFNRFVERVLAQSRLWFSMRRADAAAEPAR